MSAIVRQVVAARSTVLLIPSATPQDRPVLVGIGRDAGEVGPLPLDGMDADLPVALPLAIHAPSPLRLAIDDNRPSVAAPTSGFTPHHRTLLMPQTHLLT